MAEQECQGEVEWVETSHQVEPLLALFLHSQFEYLDLPLAFLLAAS